MNRLYTATRKEETKFDVSQYGIAELLVGEPNEDGTFLRERVVAVLADGRVFYHSPYREEDTTADLLTYTTGHAQAAFGQIIDTHRLNIVTAQSDLPPFLFDLALTDTTVLPAGAELCIPEEEA